MRKNQAVKRAEAHKILASRGWLAEVDPSVATEVLAAGRLIRLRRGDALYQLGDVPGGMYSVVEGGIVLSAVGRDGLPVPGHIARPCNWFGFISVLDRQPRRLMPTANEPSLLVHVPLAELLRIREAYPAAHPAFGRLATLAETTYIAIVSDLLIASTDRRLAAVLLRVAGAVTAERPEALPVDPLTDVWAGPKGAVLTQAVLAELANASPHTVARFVDRAVEAGWIEWKYARVRILDLKRLSAFAAGRQDEHAPVRGRSGAGRE